MSLYSIGDQVKIKLGATWGRTGIVEAVPVVPSDRYAVESDERTYYLREDELTLLDGSTPEDIPTDTQIEAMGIDALVAQVASAMRADCSVDTLIPIVQAIAEAKRRKEPMTLRIDVEYRRRAPAYKYVSRAIDFADLERRGMAHMVGTPEGSPADMTTLAPDEILFVLYDASYSTDMCRRLIDMGLSPHVVLKALERPGRQEIQLSERWHAVVQYPYVKLTQIATPDVSMREHEEAYRYFSEMRVGPGMLERSMRKVLKIASDGGFIAKAMRDIMAEPAPLEIPDRPAWQTTYGPPVRGKKRKK